MNTPQIPIARQDGLVIQEMPNEVLVYDLETSKAHCLNETSAFVWKVCDGKNSVEDITALFGAHSGSPVQEELIRLAIDQLNEKNLLDRKIPLNFEGQSRRAVIKKLGLAAVVALPLVASLVAPSNVLAATSCRCPNGVNDCIAQGTTCAQTCDINAALCR